MWKCGASLIADRKKTPDISKDLKEAKLSIIIENTNNYCVNNWSPEVLFLLAQLLIPAMVVVPDENVATSRHGAEVIEGEMPEFLLDGDTTNFDLDRGFTRHLILEGDKGICIALGRPSIINTIKLLLWNKDSRSYSYYIDVSMDNEDWIRVIDYSKFLCRSWQTLYFKPRVVR